MRMTEQERRIRIRHLKRMYRIRERKERHDKKVSGLFMKRVVFTLILAAFIFTVVMIFVFLRMGSEPSTLIENVFRFLSVEGGAMALIKSVKTVKGTKSNGEIQHNDEPEQDDEEEIHRRELVCDCGSDCSMCSGRICSICFRENAVRQTVEQSERMAALCSYKGRKGTGRRYRSNQTAICI